MSDILKTGAAWLGQQLKASASETVTYTRGAVSVSVQATLGQSLLKLDDNFDGRIQRTDADFVIIAQDLTDAFAARSSTFGEPKRGDRITVGFPEGNRVYEALAPGREPCWKWEDAVGHTLLRIHGTYVANA